jgi:sulfur carrier protein ThiS
MRVTLIYHNTPIILDSAPSSLLDALTSVDVDPELVVAIRDGIVIMPSEQLHNGDTIHLVPNFVGG